LSRGVPPTPRPRLLAAAAAICALAGTAGAAVVNVSTVSQLNNAVFNASSHDEIVIAPGDYYLSRQLEVRTSNLLIRGATGNRDDVRLHGSGMNTYGVNEGICIGADYVTVRDLTLKDFHHNAVHIRAENDADYALLSNVKTWDVGQRHVKGSGGGSAGAVSDHCVIEDVYMLQTTARADGNHHGDYIGGIDCMGVRDWIIRDCVAEGIRGHFDGGNGAIFLWQGVEGVTIERNRILGCVKGIALGNPSGPSSDIFTSPYHATDVLIRNNFVLRGAWTTGNNIALELCNVKDVQVYNNTLYSDYAAYFRTLSIYDEDDPTGKVANLDIAANLIRGRVWDHADGDWSQAALEAAGNLFDTAGNVIVPAWFADAASGDFHLTDQALAAIDAAGALAEVPEDFDSVARGPNPDLGGDEFRWPGDVDGDNAVSYIDLGVLATRYGQTAGAGWADGDFTGDGAVGYVDLGILGTYYGWELPGAGAGRALPEPTAAALLAIAGIGMISRKRR